MPMVRFIFFTMFLLTISLAGIVIYMLAQDEGRVTITAPRPIPEDRWHYHILQPDQIADICSAFVDQRTHKGLPIACTFKNLITNECHLFLSPGSPGALFALDYEKKRCAGADIITP